MDAQFLQKLIDEITDPQAGIYNVVYFYGNSKRITTIIDAITSKCCNKKVVRTNGTDFREETIQLILNRKMHMPECNLYSLENIDKIAGMEANEQRLYGVLDWLMESGIQIVISGATPTKAIKKLAPRIRAQIDGGISFYVE